MTMGSPLCEGLKIRFEIPAMDLLVCRKPSDRGARLLAPCNVSDGRSQEREMGKHTGRESRYDSRIETSITTRERTREDLSEWLVVGSLRRREARWVQAGEVSPVAKMTMGLCTESRQVLQHSHYHYSSRMYSNSSL